jgi:hypothetical protein
MLLNVCVMLLISGFASMVQLAMAVGTSHHLPPLPLVAQTTQTMLSQAHSPVSTPLDVSTLLDSARSWIGLGSSMANDGSSSSSSKSNLLAQPVSTHIYADFFLYVQAACYITILQASLLLAASISVVTYVDVLLLRTLDWWRLEMQTDDKFLGFGRLLTSLLKEWLPRPRHWWASIDVQQHDFLDVPAALFLFWSYTAVINFLSDYLPYWLCKAMVLGYIWRMSTPIARPRQQARLVAAVCLATKLLCAYTDVPMPPSAYAFISRLGLLSCLEPEPTDEDLHSLHQDVIVVGGVVGWSVIATFAAAAAAVIFCVAYAWRFGRFAWKLGSKVLRVPLQAVWYVVSAVLNRSSSLIVMVGAAEMTAAFTVAQWWRVRRAKLHVRFKYVRRIWRRTGGNLGTFLW